MPSFDSLFSRTFDLLEALNDRNDLPELLRTICSSYGLKTAAYFGLNVLGGGQQEPYLAVTYSSDWINHYRIENYVMIDPVIRNGFSACLPVEWSSSNPRNRRLRKFFGEASEFGIGCHGLTFPIRGRSGDRALFTVTSTESLRDWEASLLSRKRDLHILAYHLHQKIMAIEGAEHPPVKLAPREAECLTWIANGKTHWETSVILGLSKRTVDFYLENARAKMDAMNSTHAASKAVSQALIIL